MGSSRIPVHYDWGKEVSDSDKNKGILYGLLFHLLKVLAPSEKWDVCLKELDKLSELSGKAKELYQEKAERWAKENKRRSLSILLEAELTMEKCILLRCAGLWKCSGSTPAASIPASISMVHLR